MTSPPTTRLNTRLTKTRIFPTMVMVHPPWVGPSCGALRPQAAWRRRFPDRFSPENERGGTMPPAVSSVNANLSRPSHRSFVRATLADGLPVQFPDALGEAVPQLGQVPQFHLVVQPQGPQLIVLGLDHRQFE